MNWLARLFRKRKLETQLDSELRFHLEQRTADLVAAGVEPAEARRRAMIEFGGVERAKEECRESRGTYFLETLVADLRYGVRMLRKSPGFTIVAVLTLALGIGATTTTFSVINTVLLQPLPYKDSSRLVRIWFRSPVYSRHPMGYSPSTAAAIRKEVKVLDPSVTYSVVPQTWNINGQPAVLDTVQVTAGFFAMLGLRPAIGHFFSRGEFRQEANGVAVVSYRIWQERFGARPSVLSQTITLNDKPYTIVGVAQKGFHFPSYHFSRFPQQADIWTPLPEDAVEAAADTTVLGRLRRGSSLDQLQAQLAAISARLAHREFGSTYARNGGWSLTAMPLQEQLVGSARPALLLLFAATGLVLLIAIANVASLQLARSRERAREMGIRTALGATRGRVTSQWLTESCLTAIGGGVAGLALAIWGVGAIRALAPSSIPRIGQIHPDWAVAGFGLGVSILAGALAGLALAIRVSQLDPSGVIHGGENRTEVSHRRSSTLRAIVIGETALAVVLMVCSGLLTKSLDRLIHIQTGMRTAHLLTFDAELIEAKYAKPSERIAFFENALRQMRLVPGAESVGLSSATVLANVTFLAPVLRSGRAVITMWEHRDISPGYFPTLGIPLLHGRDFNPLDNQNSAPVAIVNEAMARELWGSANPVGKSLQTEEKQPRRFEVVGEVADARDNHLRSNPPPELYTPMLQTPSESVTFLVRAVGPSSQLGHELRNNLWSLDPNLLLSNQRSLDEILNEAHAGPLFETRLTDVFALLGLLLGLVGIYGMFSYAVEGRRREIGLRVALGAEKQDILRLVLGQWLRVIGWGLAIGLAGALAAARMMRTLLYGVSTTDPATFAGLSALVAIVSLAACYIPARRAMRVDPVLALRQE